MHNCERFCQLQWVRATETLKTSHRPDGIFTCFALMLAGRRCVHRHWHGDLLIVHHHWRHSYQLCACSRSKFPIAPMGFSHLSHFVLAGWRCVHRRWHGELLIVHHHWQHSYWSACSCSKVPIAPMGLSDVLRLCLQGGAVGVQSGSVTFSSCTITGNTAYYVRAHPQNFPSPRWEYC